MSHCIKCNSILEDHEVDICTECKEDNNTFEDKLEQELSSIEDHPLTERQQSLINYLRSNVDDLEDVFEDW
jgi:hypothetical protein